MAINILDMLKSQLGGQIAGQLGKQFGENEQATKSGIDALIPTILGGLLKQVASPGGADKLDKTMKDGGYDGGLLDGLTGMLTGGGTDAVSGKGGDLVASLFGDKAALLMPILSKVTGLKLDSIKSLLAIVAPLVLSFLGKQQKTLGLDANGLANMLISQKDSIGAALPPGVSDAMGLGALAIPSPTATRQASAATGSSAPGSSGVAMKVLVPLALLAAVGYGCYLYIFAGIRPSGPEGNVVLDAPPESSASRRARTDSATESMATEPAAETPAEAPATTPEPGTTPEPAGTEKAAAGGLGALGLPDLSKMSELGGVPDLKSLLGSMSESLGKVKDVETAKAAVPELEAVSKQLESMSSGFGALPDAMRTKLSEVVNGMLPDFQSTVDKVLAIPGVGEILKPIIDQVMAKVATFKG